MKAIDSLRSKVGDDKLLHFLVFGLAVAIGFFFSTLVGLLTVWMMVGVSVVKELVDDSFQWKDIIAGFLGGTFTTVIYFLITLIN